jgi:hypothetical protein
VKLFQGRNRCKIWFLSDFDGGDPRPSLPATYEEYIIKCGGEIAHSKVKGPGQIHEGCLALTLSVLINRRVVDKSE